MMQINLGWSRGERRQQTKCIAQIPLDVLQGIPKKVSLALQKVGIETIEDLLNCSSTNSSLERTLDTAKIKGEERGRILSLWENVHKFYERGVPKKVFALEKKLRDKNIRIYEKQPVLRGMLTFYPLVKKHLRTGLMATTELEDLDPKAVPIIKNMLKAS